MSFWVYTSSWGSILHQHQCRYQRQQPEQLGDDATGFWLPFCRGRGLRQRKKNDVMLIIFGCWKWFQVGEKCSRLMLTSIKCMMNGCNGFLNNCDAFSRLLKYMIHWMLRHRRGNAMWRQMCGGITKLLEVCRAPVGPKKEKKREREEKKKKCWCVIVIGSVVCINIHEKDDKMET